MKKSFFTIIKDTNVPCTWNTIKVGYDLNLVTKEDVSKFSEIYLEKHPMLSNKYILDAIIEIDSIKLDDFFQKIYSSLNLVEPANESPEWNSEWFKIRYAFMNNMLKVSKNDEFLLDEIESIYADFGYPVDMKSLIYYMPTDNNNENLSTEEARKLLVKNILMFIEQEKKKVQKNQYREIPQRVVSD